jgi:hypothetical protein
VTNLEQKQEAMRQHWEPLKRARNRTPEEKALRAQMLQESREARARGPNRTPEQRAADAERLKLAQKARGMKPRAKPNGNSDIDLTMLTFYEGSNRRLIALKKQYMELVEDDKKVAHTPCVKKWYLKKWIKWNR